MEYIWVIFKITGAGYDCDTIGFFESDISARNAIEKILKEKGLRWTNYVYHNKTQVKVHVPYFLEYSIVMKPKNMIV